MHLLVEAVDGRDIGRVWQRVVHQRAGERRLDRHPVERGQSRPGGLHAGSRLEATGAGEHLTEGIIDNVRALFDGVDPSRSVFIARTPTS